MKKSLLIVSLLIGCITTFNSFSQISYQWVKSVNSGSPGDNTGKAVTKDKQGNVYVTGIISRGSDDVNFNTYGNNPVNISNPKSGNCFFAKYTPDGTCAWAKTFDLYSLAPFIPTAGGTGIVVDNNNDIYIIGAFKDSIDVDLTNNEYKLKSKGGSDCFLVKYSENLDLIWAKQIGGLSDDAGTSLTIDTTYSDIYVTGTFSNDTAKFYNNDVQENVIANAGGTDIFLAKYESNGNLTWTKAIGANGNDVATSIDFNSSLGYFALTGSFQDTVDFNLGQSTPQLDTAIGTTDAFVGKFMTDGTCAWKKNLGHNAAGNTALGTAVKIDHNYAKIYLAGNFSGALELNPLDPTNIESALTQRDMFFAKYDLSDGTYNWGNSFGSTQGGPDTAAATGIAIDSDGDNIYLTGGFSGEVNFDPNGNSTITSSGIVDAFIAKYDEDGNYITASAIGGEGADLIGGIAFTSPENIYIIGSFKDTVDFNPSVGVANRNNAHTFGNALFIAKYRQGTGSIIGGVTYGNASTPLSIGANKAKLFTQIPNDGNQAMQLVAEIDINSSGTYYFTGIPAGTYYILAVANNIDYPNIAATYYGDTTHWQNAEPINVEDDSSYTKNIHMIEYSPLNGNATLSGYVYEGGGFDRVQGDPIPGRDIILDEDPGNAIISHTQTNENGYYEFTNVPAGCYKIYINIPGLPMDSTYKECPTATDSILNLNFIADSNSIDITPITTSINESSIYLQSALKVYPNPHAGMLFTELLLPKEALIKLELYSIVGEKVLSIGNESKKQGHVKVLINTTENNIPTGAYFLKIFVDNEEIATKKVVQID